MRQNYRKPDPLILLAVFVGLGVIVTTSAQAEAPGAEPAVAAAPATASAPGLWNRFRESALMLDPVNRLEKLADSPVAQLATGRQLGVARLGRKGGDLSLSLMDQVPRSEQTAELATGIFFSLERQW